MSTTPSAGPIANPQVKLSIDGVEVSVAPGSTIIQAAGKADKFIPHFCYHAGLSVVGQCRMCFVEIEGAPKLATACSQPVTEGMKVHTHSDKVKAGQNATLEFTLLNHPLDCPICDRGGECKLQDYTYEYGPPLSRMVDDKRLKDKHRAISEQIILDQERCILCTRCTRFSAEVDGRTELVVVNRGSADVVDVFENRPLKSNFSGNVVDLCPVGALTAKDFRFQARPWELKSHDAICTGCAVGCSVSIHTKHRHFGIPRPDGLPPVPEIERLMPRENAAVNEWWMCDKGRWGYHFHNENASRLSTPLARRDRKEALAAMSLREIQLILETRTAPTSEPWEFWIDDSFPHEGIAWAKELMKSWSERGRKVKQLNPATFGGQVLNAWAARMSHGWVSGQADFSKITTVVSLHSARELETVSPILALKLGQRLRRGNLKWDTREASSFFSSKDDSTTTAYLLPVPSDAANLALLSKAPAESNLLILWGGANARGLINEGIVPVESLSGSLKGAKPKGPVFFFSQKTQNPIAPALFEYLSQAPFLVVADSFKSAISERADIVLPLTSLYESQATLTNLQNLRQSSKGIRIDHPNNPAIHRGDALLNPSLRLF